MGWKKVTTPPPRRIVLEGIIHENKTKNRSETPHNSRLICHSQKQIVALGQRGRDGGGGYGVSYWALRRGGGYDGTLPSPLDDIMCTAVNPILLVEC